MAAAVGDLRDAGGTLRIARQSLKSLAPLTSFSMLPTFGYCNAARAGIPLPEAMATNSTG